MAKKNVAHWNPSVPVLRRGSGVPAASTESSGSSPAALPEHLRELVVASAKSHLGKKRTPMTADEIKALLAKC